MHLFWVHSITCQHGFLTLVYMQRFNIMRLRKVLQRVNERRRLSQCVMILFHTWSLALSVAVRITVTCFVCSCYCSNSSNGQRRWRKTEQRQRRGLSQTEVCDKSTCMRIIYLGKIQCYIRGGFYTPRVGNSGCYYPNILTASLFNAGTLSSMSTVS